MEPKIETPSIGINSGFAEISDYRKGQPTMICGLGRSGTSAMAKCFMLSPSVRFVADNPESANLEIKGMNHAIRDCDGKALQRFREETSATYCREFVFKNPVFEILQTQSRSLRDAWSGANLIVMVRDPVAVGCREKTVEMDQRKLSSHVRDSAARSLVSVEGAMAASRTMGVVMVSYEKLLLFPGRLAEAINAWMNSDKLDATQATAVVSPEDSEYLERQKKGMTILARRLAAENCNRLTSGRQRE